MLNQVLRKLDKDKLKIYSKRGLIACPFSNIFKGPQEFSQPLIDLPIYERRENELICAQLCGALFPKGYWPGTCPCYRIKTPGYVKRRFWHFWALHDVEEIKMHETIKWLG